MHESETAVSTLSRSGAALGVRGDDAGGCARGASCVDAVSFCVRRGRLGASPMHAQDFIQKSSASLSSTTVAARPFPFPPASSSIPRACRCEFDMCFRGLPEFPLSVRGFGGTGGREMLILLQCPDKSARSLFEKPPAEAKPFRVAMTVFRRCRKSGCSSARATRSAQELYPRSCGARHWRNQARRGAGSDTYTPTMTKCHRM